MGQNEVEILLGTLTKGPQPREELAVGSALPADRFEGALALAAALGDVTRDTTDGKYQISSRGVAHLKALRARRNDGEDHVETLTDFAMFLAERAIALDIPTQVAGVLLPDGQFRWGDAIYNVEIECSTLAKAAEQVVRNVKKGREAGNRVLIVLPDRAGVSRALAVLDAAFPGMRLWPDGVGLVWRGEDGIFHPHRVPGTAVWPFLEDDWLAEDAPTLPQVDRTTEPVQAATDPLPRLLQGIIQDFLKAGKTEATSGEIFAALPASEQARRTDEQVGVALSGLGLKHHRVRVNGTRPRVYELSTPWTSDGPALGTSGPDGPEADRHEPARWSSNSPTENDEDGPAGPDGPAD